VAHCFHKKPNAKNGGTMDKKQSNTRITGSKGSAKPKKKYKKPQLELHGDLRKVTLANKGGDKSEGSGGPGTRV
jgi:hypothetical protein